ncbi:telomere repeat-binding factor 4 [Arachis duranensis]|uniref:MYB transcription factor n=1 Tax=Arachis duranensis TaxID=130453 RepID=A0A9C6TJX6_ARADU|nr:telomere repeat-binding factor 4 [Arachis duranensis]
MGNQKQKWTQDEEDALIAGVEKHGPGKWKNILKDPQFAPFLTSRSNIDLKDKWRNLSVSNGTQGSKEKSRVPRIKGGAPIAASPVAAAASNAIVVAGEDATIVTTMIHQPDPSVAVGDSSQNDEDAKNRPRYNAMVLEALSALKDANGSDLNAIVNFIEVRLFFIVMFSIHPYQGKLEKVQNCYKIKKDYSPVPKSPVAVKKNVWPQRQQPPPPPEFVASNETIKEAAETAAYRIAEAESKSYLAAEAVKEAERIARLAEDAEAMLQLVQQIYDACSRGEAVILAS